METKPFDFAVLLVRIKALLRRTPVERSDVLHVGDLELNRLTQRVRREGHRIDLTDKKYSLLEYLACSPGRVFSRTMILNHVWDQSFEGVTNIVDVYVRHLRKKVDESFPVKLIHTVRGVGYCIREPELERKASLGSPPLSRHSPRGLVHPALRREHLCCWERQISLGSSTTYSRV